MTDMSGQRWLDKEFLELTRISAALLMGNHLDPLRNVCTDQLTICTHKLSKHLDDLQEHNRKLAVALIGVRDQLSPDDNSDTDRSGTRHFVCLICGESWGSHYKDKQSPSVESCADCGAHAYRETASDARGDSE